MKPTLEQVDQYEVPSFLAERIAQIYQVPQDFADGLIFEAKRMLYLCAITDKSVAPSDRVDWAWHEMIMFTKFYKSYAEFLGDFIHHVPNPPESEKDPHETWEEIQEKLGRPRKEGETYTQTKALYKKELGIDPDPLYWP